MNSLSISTFVSGLVWCDVPVLVSSVTLHGALEVVNEAFGIPRITERHKMNLHLLRLFMEVGNLKSFSKAAEALRISQPAVSKGLRELELQLGVTLIDRSGRLVRTTSTGERLLGQVREIFAAERATEELLNSLKGVQAGDLAIGASTTIATYYLPDLIGQFHALYPNVRLGLHSDNSKVIADQLKRRNIDIALIEGPVSDPDITTQIWRMDSLVVVAGAMNPLARRKRVAMADLKNSVFISREPGSGTREVVEVALAARDSLPSSIIEVNSTEAAKRLVAAGIGFTIISELAARDFLKARLIRKIAVDSLHIERPLLRLTLRNRQGTAAAKAFEYLLDQFVGARKL
jgi:DNA-binding transcriptional LysR family regulator